MQETLIVSICPNCESPAIERVLGRWRGSYEGQTYEVANLEHYVCPDCGEKLYPPEAMRKIQACSPAYSKRREQPRGRPAPNPAARAGG